MEPTTTTAPAPTSASAKKATKKPAAKAKAQTKQKPGANGDRFPLGLRPKQVDTLKVLAKVGKPMTRTQIYEKLGMTGPSPAGLEQWIGVNDAKVRAQKDKEGYPCLLTLGFVKSREVGEPGGEVSPAVVYEITPKGRQALSRIS